MSVNVPQSMPTIPVNVGYKPIPVYNQYMSYPAMNSFAPLEQDVFVKSGDILNQDKEAIEDEKDEIINGTYYSYSSVQDLQNRINQMKRELEFNKKQLAKYPNNPEYGWKIDKLEKEIKELVRQLQKAC